jgi:cyclopropane fatty-acyl-phospholipid synthase-like methyltransferase
VLEVGNVLSHYGVTGQTVLDKYEVIPGVLNEDIVDFTPESRFDTVIAISTLEHVGWDENPREPEKVFKAIDNVKSCARADGHVLVTMPIGHNEALDAGLREGRVKFAKESWLARRDHRNRWAEVERDEALRKAYGRPYTGANGLYVGMISAD